MEYRAGSPLEICEAPQQETMWAYIYRTVAASKAFTHTRHAGNRMRDGRRLAV